MNIEAPVFHEAWLALLTELSTTAPKVEPRGITCYERRAVRFHVSDGYANVLYSPMRKLSYRFMVAEWLFIWFGHHDVKTIAQYNKNIAQFSDNGVDFNGAYGPPVVRQWPYIVETLTRDPFSRQAVFTIYQPPLGPTKDVPCTISVQFLVRNGAVHTIVNMRSSDVWLGLPYDFFNFSMLGNTLAAQLGLAVGAVTFNLGSSHLYDSNREMARQVVAAHHASYPVMGLRSPQLPSAPPESLHEALKRGLDAQLFTPTDLWGHYARVLVSSTSAESYLALEALHDLATHS